MCGCGWVCGHDLYGEFQPVRVGLVLVCSGSSCVLSLRSPCCFVLFDVVLSCQVWCAIACLFLSHMMLGVVLSRVGFVWSCHVLSSPVSSGSIFWFGLALSDLVVHSWTVVCHVVVSCLLFVSPCFVLCRMLWSDLVWTGLIWSGLDCLVSSWIALFSPSLFRIV